ncbi:MAG: trypsin-like serine protease [Pseudomonadota bacterium]
MHKSSARTLAAMALWLAGGMALAAPPVLEMPAVDVAAVLARDALQKGPQPYRFAVPVAMQATPASEGQWSIAEDGRALWQLRVHSAGATSLNFGFTQYSLPMGAELRIVAADGSSTLGPYGSEYNTLGQLWTPVIRTDAATIELRLPAALRAAVQLTLGSVNHGFRGFGAKDEISAKSGSCNIDVVCSDGNDWRREIRSVARYTIGGALLCTGQLVNNSAQDFTPYFLTANHCLMTAAQAPTTVYYWNYQTSRCGGTPDGSLDQTQSGALYLAGSGGGTDIGSDFTLMQLLQRPDPAFKVYYAGWDRRDLAPVGVTGIHHPNGDEKRISMEFDQTFVSAYAQTPDSPLSTLMPTHLMVVSWDRGVTEGGSSGSGIWNREHRLVGQLSGGASSCDAPKEPDWYGRMFSNFNATALPLTSLSSWLDPQGNVEVLNGADPATSAPTTPVTPVPGSGGGSGGAAAGSGGGGAMPINLLLLLMLRRRR